MNQLPYQVVLSALMVWLLQFMKKSSLVPWLSAETPKLNRAAAVVTSLGTALGIHITFSADQGVLMITGLTLAGIGHFAWQWLVSFVSQQVLFQATVKAPTIPPELLSALTEWVKQQQGLPSSRDLDQVTTEKSFAKGAS